MGVASTKAFTCQLVALACVVIATARARGAIGGEDEATLSRAIAEVPARAAEVLNHDEALRALAHELAEARDVLYIGRGSSYPIALEGALKLKEISYLHAEGFAAGELKHGPIALIDETVPVIVIAPSDDLFEKTASNMEEVIAAAAASYSLATPRGSRRWGSWRGPRSSFPRCTPSSPRSFTRFRCSSSRTTPRSSRAPTSTSPATSPNQSRWSSQPRLVSFAECV